MLEARIRDVMLVDELQLDGRLCAAVASGDRAEFALLLSLLSPDVTDAAQFADPRAQAPRNEDLRRRLGLGPELKHYAQSADFARAPELAEALHQGGQSAVRLCECLSPEPLTEQERALAPEVYGSLSPLMQEKFDLLQDERKPAHEHPRERGDGFGVISETEESRRLAGTDKPLAEDLAQPLRTDRQKAAA